jgi:hypothetical protein
MYGINTNNINLLYTSCFFVTLVGAVYQATINAVTADLTEELSKPLFKGFSVLQAYMVGGGIVAGLLISAMYAIMFVIQLKILHKQTNSIPIGNQIILVAMSQCYLLQTLISPDSIFLFTFGAILLGSVYGLHLEKSKEIQKK